MVKCGELNTEPFITYHRSPWTPWHGKTMEGADLFGAH